MREIGSEFWLDCIPSEYTVKPPSWLNLGKDYRLLLSGRTAIDYVLRDITTTVKSVYFPSYCCSSMLQPFIDRGIQIDLYKVIFSNEGLEYIVDQDKSCDVFFSTSYFGFSSTVMDSIIKAFKSKGTIVIEDITHRLLSEQPCCNESDYTVASLRKWFAIPSGGLAAKQKGKFSRQTLNPPMPLLINTKIKAMTKKEEYIKEYEKQTLIKESNKEDFLEMYSQFNKSLHLDYKSIEIDGVSRSILSTIDIDTIKKKRRENAFYINEAVKKLNNIKLNNTKLNNIKPLISNSDFSKDCPLFFPIRARKDIRDALKNYLITNRMYCPIHWPIPDEFCLSTDTSDVYLEELSLICDQRYDLYDMKRLVNTIGGFLSTI